MIDVTVSGTSIIVLRTAHLLAIGPVTPIFPQRSARHYARRRQRHI